MAHENNEICITLKAAQHPNNMIRRGFLDKMCGTAEALSPFLQLHACLD